jgi:hypothetical protein
MNSTFLRKWAGLLSIFCMPAGYFLVISIITAFPHADRLLYYLATYIWLGVGLFFSIVGFIRGSRSGQIFAIIGFILLLVFAVLLMLPTFAKTK